MQSGANLTPSNALMSQQQEQQRQGMLGFGGQQPECLISNRVRAEAQAAAAAIFLGAPLPGGGDDSEEAQQQNQVLGASEMFGDNPNFLGALPPPNALPNAQHMLSMAQQQQANSNVHGNFQLSSNEQATMNSPQAQHQFHSIQTSLENTRMQQIQQQFQLERQLRQQQQQQQQQQNFRRYSLGMHLPSGDNAFQQQPPPPQQRQDVLSLTDQLRQHQHRLAQLNRIGPSTDTDGASGDYAPLQEHMKASHEPSGAKRGTTKSMNSNTTNVEVASPTSAAGGGKKDVPFPQKLHEILCSPEYDDVICWMPHGKSWRILKPTAFENSVIPMHFRHSKYASFMRQVSFISHCLPTVVLNFTLFIQTFSFKQIPYALFRSMGGALKE
jgi:hypothetical protein